MHAYMCLYGHMYALMCMSMHKHMRAKEQTLVGRIVR